jgi:hypothetical protein
MPYTYSYTLELVFSVPEHEWDPSLTARGFADEAGIHPSDVTEATVLERPAEGTAYTGYTVVLHGPTADRGSYNMHGSLAPGALTHAVEPCDCHDCDHDTTTQGRELCTIRTLLEGFAVTGDGTRYFPPVSYPLGYLGWCPISGTVAIHITETPTPTDTRSQAEHAHPLFPSPCCPGEAVIVHDTITTETRLRMDGAHPAARGETDTAELVELYDLEARHDDEMAYLCAGCFTALADPTAPEAQPADRYTPFARPATNHDVT